MVKDLQKERERQKKWRDNNKEYEKQRRKKYYDEHKEKELYLMKTWKQSNAEKHMGHNRKHLLKLNLANKNISNRTLNAWAIQIKKIQPKCMTCNATENLHAHHILAKVDYPQYALRLLNGITLCEDCHISVHHSPSIDKTNITEV
jgi:hypothetical protein